MKRISVIVLILILLLGIFVFRTRLLQFAKFGHRPYNLIFITVDTLRADHTPFGNYSRSTMPFSQQFFHEGINFTSAETVRSNTSPSYASMLTGLYPYHHGVRDLYFPLNDQIETLQERLKKSGYVTAGFVSSFVMVARFSGLRQGFDIYDDRVSEKEASRNNYERTATHTVEVALSWLKKRDSSQPFFLFLHFIDPHGPYNPPAEFKQSFHSGLELELVRKDIPHYQFLNGALNYYDYIDRYDDEILYLDSQLKRLYESLSKQGLADNSWILFVADHGESQGERGIYFAHGNNCYEAQTRVPVVWLPPSDLRQKYKSGTRSATVSIVDITPTALDALHIHADSALDGTSVVPLMLNDSDQPRVRIIERVLRQSETIAGTDSRYKLIRNVHDGTEELYDLKTDPQETKNLIGSMKAPAALTAAVDQYISQSHHYKLPFTVKKLQPGKRDEYVKTRDESLSDEEREKLKALGYVD